ncbi:NUDIX hydrolase [Pseudomonas aeruginosa]
MTKTTYTTGFMKASVPEERLDFMLATFGDAPLAKMFGQAVGETYGEITSIPKAVQFVVAVCAHFIARRDIAGDRPSLALLLECAQLDRLKAFLDEEKKAEKAKALIKTYLEALEGEPAERHEVLTAMLNSAVQYILKKLHGRESQEGMVRSIRIGDVVAEGPGFEVVVGPRMQNVVNYPGGRPAVMIIHDPRDGHFLLVERYSEHHKGFILEMPKAAPSAGQSRNSMIGMALQDETGLHARDLEKIGEIWPDTHTSMGVYDVFYGNFDLEETINPKNPLVRSVKRMTEDGFYQAAFENQMNCALSLGAISIWHAFESVRKKRIANMKRVRTPKGATEPEAEVEAEPEGESEE